MLSELRLEGFKGYRVPQSLELKPMTVLCGTNGCGKSTLLQAILMMKQSFEGPRSPRIVRLNGDLVRLGGLVDVLSGRDAEQSARVGISFRSEWNNDTVEYEDRLVRNAVHEALTYAGFDDDAYDATINLSIELGFRAAELGLGSRAEMQDLSVELKLDEMLVFRATLQYQERALEDLRECRMRVEAPSIESIGLDEEFDVLVSMFGLSIESIRGLDQDSGDYGTPLYLQYFDTVALMVSSTLDSINENHPHVRRAKAANLLARLLISAQAGMRDCVAYVGPLRAFPQRDYRVTSDAAVIGPAGEDAVQVYVGERERSLNQVLELGETDLFDAKTWTLSEAMDYWFDVMGLGHIEPFESEYSTSVLLDGASPGVGHLSLADTGFGYSQVFPILLQGLRLPMTGTLVLEQPEIHLHPRMQMQIADFLLALAECERGVLVETHSDHLVNRIVRRVVEGKISADMVGIYFVSSGPQGPVIEEVEIDPIFGIRNWPLGFFDQGVDEQEAIMRASLNRRVEEGRN